MADGFQIVSARLFNSFVCIDRSVSCSACQVLAIFVRDMLTFTVFKALCQSEVNDVDLILRLISATNQEVVGFDVSMNDSLLVNFLNSH